MKKQVSVYALIITYNRLKMLKLTLKSLFNQTYPIKKIVVVDNKSTDDTFNYLKKLKIKHKNLLIFQNKANLGMANAINLALKNIWQEKWDYVLISDDDNIAEKNSLKNLIKNAKPNLILNSLLLDKSTKKLSFPLTDIYTEKNYQTSLNQEINSSIPFNFTLISKNVFKKIGFLNENYFIRGEEIDFIIRCLLKKINIKIIPSSIAYCLNKRSLKEIKIFNLKINRELIDPIKNYYLTRNTLNIIKKYKSKINKSKNKYVFYNFYPYLKYNLYIFIFLYFIYNLFLYVFIYRKSFFNFFRSLILAYYHFLINKKGKINL